MKKHIIKLFLFAFITMPIFSHAQTEIISDSGYNIINQQKGDPDHVFSVVDQMPQFPGGETKLFKYLKKIKYPKEARKNGIHGRVYINFIIDTTGQVTNAKVLRGIGGGCDEEALKIVQDMPKWKPGMQKGKPVSVQYNLPINFNLK